MQQIFEHAMLGYYFLLLTFRARVIEDGEGWAKKFLPLVTVKNLAFVFAHAAVSCVHWDTSCPWRPSARTEAPAEHHFGMVKSHYRGAPSLKDAVLGTQHAHFNQYRDQKKLVSRIGRGKIIQTLTNEQATEISQACFKRACNLVCWISTDKAGP